MSNNDPCIVRIVYHFYLQLQPHLEPGEHGLSLDTDVLLWIESRAFDKKPPLREVFDFVIVSSSQHSEFEEFRRRYTHRDYSVLPTYPLLEYWNNVERTQPLPTLMLYGKQHLKVHYTEMDQLCEWVLKTREKLVMHIKPIFIN